ncbi:uncharacterized protein LOC108209152 isoform X1 [Daucus carota subsp. sativus]|uniref:uncharacterized protein LOC108209152 isoform X1 n=1 Tax=Daucus carota subsp. sativus TaxID=79200 RepID=UPI0007EF1FAB|nr:PREDICTED: uncharacterized protein LOC108208019 [Daucus carota subsp. sativus]
MAVDRRPNLGGMEKAFSLNIMMLITRYFAGLPRIDINRDSAPANGPRKKCKRSAGISGSRVWRAWDILPDELLVSVLMKLDIIDYLAFSGVCRSWRLASLDIRNCFMERLQPLVVARRRYCKKACVLFNMFDRKSSKSMLPNLAGRKFWHLVSGYLITIDCRELWLVNLMTRHELHFSALPACMGKINDTRNRAVLFRSTQLSGVFMVVFSKMSCYLMLSESGSSRWQIYFLPKTSFGIFDVKILDGKIFVLTCDLQFGEFNPRGDPVFKLYNFPIPIQLSGFKHLQLATSDNKLYIIVSHQVHRRNTPGVIIKVQYHSLYELDYKEESVKRVHDMGSKSLFLSEFQSAVVDTTGWGAGNCVCVLQPMFHQTCVFYGLSGMELSTLPFLGTDKLAPYSWFFPSESWDINCVGDEFGM